MIRNALTQTVDEWTAQAVVASAYLVGLYRSLDDSRQLALAMQAQGHCEERVQRLGLQAVIGKLQAKFAATHADGTAREQEAWEQLIVAQAGLAAFHGLVDDHPQHDTLRGQRNVTNKALLKAMRGYRSAFPEEVTRPGVERAIGFAATQCSDSFSLDVEDVTDEERDGLRQELRGNIVKSLIAWTSAN
jgi:hypothetical protein